MNTHMAANDFFSVRLFLLDTIFKMEKDNPAAKTINRDTFLSFTDELGSRGEINFGSYDIVTD